MLSAFISVNQWFFFPVCLLVDFRHLASAVPWDRPERSGRADLLRRIDDGSRRRLGRTVEERVIGALHPLQQALLQARSNVGQFGIVAAVVRFLRIETEIEK